MAADQTVAKAATAQLGATRQRDKIMRFQQHSPRSDKWAANAVASTPAPGHQTEEYFTIGEMARTFHISLRALRFYEDRGLMKPTRHGSVRLYNPRQRVRLQLILKGKKLGFTLTEIREMLTHQGEGEFVDFEQTLGPAQIATQIEHLERQRSGLELAIQELRASHQRIAAEPAAVAAAG